MAGRSYRWKSCDDLVERFDLEHEHCDGHHMDMNESYRGIELHILPPEDYEGDEKEFVYSCCWKISEQFEDKYPGVNTVHPKRRPEEKN